MKTNKLPNGVRDYEGRALKIKDFIGSELIKLFEFYSYEKIDTPTFEYLDVFADSFNDTSNMYVISSSIGELMALKSDATKAIARVVAQKNQIELPIRYCYQTSKFIRLNDLNGNINELTQCGIELIGKKGLKADVEVIKLAILSLKKIGFTEFNFHICSNEFLNLFFEDFKLESTSKNQILKLIKTRDLLSLETYLNTLNISNDVKDLMSKFLIAVGDIELIKKIGSSLKNYKCAKALLYLEDIYNSLGNLNSYVSFDFSIATFDTYYTGISFYACFLDSGKEILLGGRYDNLVINPKIGKIPAVGFAIELDYILANADNLVKLPDYEYYYFFLDTYTDSFDKELKELYKKGKVIVTVSECDNYPDAYSEFLSNSKYKKFIRYNDQEIRTEEERKC